MIDLFKVRLAVASGLSYVCATCENYWGARDKGIPEDRCLSKDNCGSPIAGDVFHEYVGPITAFDRFCFACGGPSTHGLRVTGSVRVIGACSEHVELVKTLQPEGKNAVKLLIISKEKQQTLEEATKPEGKPQLRLKVK